MVEEFFSERSRGVVPSFLRMVEAVVELTPLFRMRVLEAGVVGLILEAGVARLIFS